MGSLNAVKINSLKAIELSQLREELRRVSDKFESRQAELPKALEHQSAESEILGVIASSPTDLQPVLDAMIDSAAPLCNAKELGSNDSARITHVNV